MVKMIFLQIALYLVACNVLCLHASSHSSECKREERSKLIQATECNSNDLQSIPDIKELLNNLRSELASFPQSRQKLDEKRASVKEQKDESEDSSEGKWEAKEVIINMIDSIKKFQSKDPLEIAKGVLDIVSKLTSLFGIKIPYVDMVKTLLTILSSPLLTESKPSVMDQLANVVHDEMIHFHDRMHAQKFDGLKRRLSEQISQLQQMKEGEKLDDPNLWNDYVQFLGELAFRFELPLPFKYENNLSEDTVVTDFVTAIVTYSEVHSLLMALLLVAKGKYQDLSNAHKDDIATVERRMNFQSEDAKEKLSFLSEKKILTYPEGVEGGKLTKIVALSRRNDKKRVVETVRHSLGLSPLPDLSTIESSAKKVNQQFMNLRSAKKCDSPLNYFSYRSTIEFINDVDYSMKIDSDEIGWCYGNQLQFVKNIPPYWWHHQNIYPCYPKAGYITLYFNNNQRVIEFAASFVVYASEIGMQETTSTEAQFSRGLPAYNARSQYTVTLKFSEDGKHYTAKAEIILCWPDRIWRFTFREDLEYKGH